MWGRLLALHRSDGFKRLFPPFLSVCANNHRDSRHQQLSFLASTSRPTACSLRWTRRHCLTRIVSGRHRIAEPSRSPSRLRSQARFVSVPGCVVTNGMCSSWRTQARPGGGARLPWRLGATRVNIPTIYLIAKDTY